MTGPGYFRIADHPPKTGVTTRLRNDVLNGYFAAPPLRMVPTGAVKRMFGVVRRPRSFVSATPADTTT